MCKPKFKARHTAGSYLLLYKDPGGYRLWLDETKVSRSISNSYKILAIANLG